MAMEWYTSNAFVDPMFHSACAFAVLKRRIFVTGSTRTVTKLTHHEVAYTAQERTHKHVSRYQHQTLF